MSLLDPMAFPDLESVTRDKVSDFVIRTEKRKALTAEGKPLFRPRTTQTLGVNLERKQAQVDLYDAVTEYVKKGYNRAVKDSKPHIGFLMVLLQRIVTSSSHAIRCTSERRLQVLENLREFYKNLSDEELEDFADLDTSMTGEMIENMMTRVIMEDANPDAEVNQTVKNFEQVMQQVREQSAVYRISEISQADHTGNTAAFNAQYWEWRCL